MRTLDYNRIGVYVCLYYYIIHTPSISECVAKCKNTKPKKNSLYIRIEITTIFKKKHFFYFAIVLKLKQKKTTSTSTNDSYNTFKVPLSHRYIWQKQSRNEKERKKK